eukprot:6205666-Pleurochrysis_carterae.AAC.2
MAAAAPGRCASCSVARAAAVAALLALPPLCNIFVPSSETLRACLLLIYQIWVWPVAICSKSPATLGAAGFALLAGAAVQKVKWDISSGFFGVLYYPLLVPRMSRSGPSRKLHIQG